MKNTFVKLITCGLLLTTFGCDSNILNSTEFSVIKDNLFPTTVNTAIKFSIGGPAVGGTGQICAVRKDSTVVCWGDNSFGQLGNGTNTNTHIPTPVLGGVSGTPLLNNITKVVSGRSNVCAISASQNIYCWGEGGYALGTGNDTEPSALTPIRVITGEQGHSSGWMSNIVDMDLGFGFACAIDNTGAVYCWGTGTEGRLGYGSATHTSTPRRVLGGEQGGTYVTDVKQISVGRANGCVVTNSNELYCWGDRRGVGRDNPASHPMAPVRVFGGDQGGTFLMNTSMVDVGWNRVCALITDGSVYCWGYSTGGAALGIGVFADYAPPKRVLGGDQGGMHLTNITQLNHSFVADVCATTAQNELYCWGNQFGLVPSRFNSGEQTPGPYLSNIKQIMMGPHTYCWVDTLERTYCSGYNNSGQLGIDPATGGGYYTAPVFYDI